MRAWISLCFALSVLTLASSVVITPDAALAAGARSPNRGIPSFYRAELQRAAKAQGEIQTANRDRWHCNGTRCEGIYLSRGFGVPACQALAHSQGSVVSFIGYDSGNHRSLRLTAAQLRQCNSGSQYMPSVRVHVGRPRSPQSGPAPDTVRTRRLVLVGNGASARSAPDTVRTRRLVLVGKGASARSAPDTVRTRRLILVGKGVSAQSAPDTVRTRRLILVGKGR